MNRNYKKAYLFYSQLYAIDSLNLTALTNLASLSNQRGMYNSSMDLYKKILSLDSTYIDAYMAIAILFKRKIDILNAFNYLHKANTLQPTNGEVANELAQLCITLKMVNQADTVLAIALENDPNNGNLLLVKAKVMDELKKYSEVIAITKRLMELGEDSQQVWALLAKAYFLSDHHQLAMDTYTEAMQIYETWSELDYYFMAMSCKALGRYEEAFDYIETVIKQAISPNTGYYFAKKADILKNLRKPNEAVASYMRSFQFHDIAIDYFNLAIIYDQLLHNDSNALKYYNLYLTKDKTDKEEGYVEYAQNRIENLKAQKLAEEISEK